MRFRNCTNEMIPSHAVMETIDMDGETALVAESYSITTNGVWCLVNGESDVRPGGYGQCSKHTLIGDAVR